MSPPLPGYSLQEVKKHCSSNDAWIVVQGRVYDVTPFLDDHPGGEDVIIRVSGGDATEDFDGVGHSSLAWSMLESYLIGFLNTATP
ncbi:hypothetical protein GpartN1_g1162.t1 [Galdieria partita]|uniref:Cytochrome b5 heme-binding domain-containing protein n=1 Tax=Galdieria partita TaxID=83374 RepID=A0A9C7UNC6_9RHOD|nr:hypothetical protein GpartN1_g1162.t1 [Galdieria partita]